MTWTQYGDLVQLILPHGRIEILHQPGDTGEHRYRIEIHTDGNVRILDHRGLLHSAQRLAYRHLCQHYERTWENILALRESVINQRASAPAPEVGA